MTNTLFNLLLVVFIVITFFTDASADETSDKFENQYEAVPKGELGIVLAGGLTPHYIGSNHFYNAAVPYPYIIYRSEIAEISQDSKVFMYESKPLVVDLAFNFRFPVYSEELENEEESNTKTDKEILSFENNTRRGMDDLPPVFFLGVQSYWRLSQWFQINVSLVSGISLENQSKYIGNIFTPSFELKPFGNSYDRDSKNESQ